MLLLVEQLYQTWFIAISARPTFRQGKKEGISAKANRSKSMKKCSYVQCFTGCEIFALPGQTENLRRQFGTTRSRPICEARMITESASVETAALIKR